MKYLAVFQKNENNQYSAYVPDIPTCAANGDTFEEARARIIDALYISTRTLGWNPPARAFTDELDPEEASENVRELVD